MFNLIHTSSHLQSQGSCCLQDCRKGRHHHPVLPCGSWKHNVGQICLCSCCQGRPNACKISSCTFQFLLFLAMAFMFSSLHHNCSLPSTIPTGQGNRLLPICCHHLPRCWQACWGQLGSSPQSCSDNKKENTAAAPTASNCLTRVAAGLQIFLFQVLSISRVFSQNKEG